jgi:hypothetical protein
VISRKILVGEPLVKTFQRKSDELELVQNEIAFVMINKLLSSVTHTYTLR